MAGLYPQVVQVERPPPKFTDRGWAWSEGFDLPKDEVLYGCVGFDWWVTGFCIYTGKTPYCTLVKAAFQKIKRRVAGKPSSKRYLAAYKPL